MKIFGEQTEICVALTIDVIDVNFDIYRFGYFFFDMILKSGNNFGCYNNVFMQNYLTLMHCTV